MKTWEMHRLVQDAMQWWLLDHRRVEEAQQEFIARLAEVIPTGAFENWRVCQILLPHVKSAATLDCNDKRTLLLWAEVMYRTGWYAQGIGSLADAARFAQNSSSIRQEMLPPDNEDVLSSEALLAGVRRDQGRWKEAEELEVQVMEARERTLGEEHPDTLTAKANLAYTLQSTDRISEAIDLMKRCAIVSSSTLGHRHLDTLSRIQQADEWAGKSDKVSSGSIGDDDASDHGQVYRDAPMTEVDEIIEDGANESDCMTSSNEDVGDSVGGVSI